MTSSGIWTFLSPKPRVNILLLLFSSPTAKLQMRIPRSVKNVSRRNSRDFACFSSGWFKCYKNANWERSKEILEDVWLRANKSEKRNCGLNSLCWRRKMSCWGEILVALLCISMKLSGNFPHESFSLLRGRFNSFEILPTESRVCLKCWLRRQIVSRDLLIHNLFSCLFKDQNYF